MVATETPAFSANTFTGIPRDFRMFLNNLLFFSYFHLLLVRKMIHYRTTEIALISNLPNTLSSERGTVSVPRFFFFSHILWILGG
jgi:hypothetical protein